MSETQTYDLEFPWVKTVEQKQKKSSTTVFKK